jgi:hypothetical protein
MILNLCAFKFPYSIFGNLERTPSPKKLGVYSVRSNWGQIGWMYASGPFIFYDLYPSGLAISVWSIGKAFLPFQFVEEVKKNIIMGYRIIHHSPEIRSPIVFADKEMFEALQNEYNKFKHGYRA